MTFDLYAWNAPRVTDPEAAAKLIRAWREGGGGSGVGGSAPEGGPFEPSNDVQKALRARSAAPPDRRDREAP
jgi:hypothetical protein